ncbi:alpha-keto acid decarboxylase family protein [Subtercola sp. YIM 133946]|uniref:alpha-keto acid decarboxylase family protein n=1 Tax=Subtercola sp. YIM 133946 TaxID=3118909 RepID=UPI002F921735
MTDDLSAPDRAPASAKAPAGDTGTPAADAPAPATATHQAITTAPAPALPPRISVGRYLATRLRQLGVEHLFGLPGDFNLSLLDEMLAPDAPNADQQRPAAPHTAAATPRPAAPHPAAPHLAAPHPAAASHPLQWVGTTNELNAAYAADGYARIRRSIGALVTTLGVGELSAINGVAGSFAEDVPVVQITGMPASRAMAEGALLHHTLVDGDFEHFRRAYAEVTAACVVLKAHSAPADIDSVLLTALTESKPVYLGVPSDVAVALVSSANLSQPLVAFSSDPRQLARFTEALRQAVYSASNVSLLVGPKVHRASVEPIIRSIADAPGVYIATQSGSKAILDESHPASVGTYLGAHTRVEAARRSIDAAPLLILAGAVMSDLLTGFFSHRFDPDAAVELSLTWARVGESTFFGVHLGDALRIVDEVLQDARLDPVAPISLGGASPVPDAVVSTPAAAPATAAASIAPAAPTAAPADTPTAPTPAAETLTHEAFWQGIQSFLTPGTTVIAEAGTAFFGAIDLTLPDDCDLLGQPVWSSIGFTLPATLGVCLAEPGRRAVLLIGDGSAQLTVQELATLLHRGLAPVVFVLNNGGYTIERAIQSPHAAYQSVTPWNFTQLPGAFGAADRAVTATVRTPTELTDALALATRTTDKLVLVEVMLPVLDSPRLLKALGEGLSAANAANAANAAPAAQPAPAASRVVPAGL